MTSCTQTAGSNQNTARTRCGVYLHNNRPGTFFAFVDIASNCFYSLLIPIHELLSRIRWDKEFGKGEFVIGYYDRIEDRIIRVPMCELTFKPNEHFSFELENHEGELHSIPLHRIREVLKDGQLIWHRDHR